MQPEFMSQVLNGKILGFDSAFECGNLDRVVMVSEKEYDLYMRPDTNSSKHHQWFYFKTTAHKAMGKVKFNILNFTKKKSLYHSGMKICICSVSEKIKQIKKKEKVSWLEADQIGWKRGCEDIEYKNSKLNQMLNNEEDESQIAKFY